jgi:hypothetical protein
VRVALATCSVWPELDEDGPELLAALAAEGLEVDICVWDDPSVDWEAYDLTVIRNTWDYWDRREDYLAWTRRVPRLANAARVVAWNTDKTYLRRLAQAGIPVVPTTWVEPGDPFTPPDHPFVVKPSISAGARDTAAYEAGDSSAAELVSRLHALGKTVMVQPYIAAVEDAGETSVLVFGGAVSHGARTSAVLTTGALGGGGRPRGAGGGGGTGLGRRAALRPSRRAARAAADRARGHRAVAVPAARARVGCSLREGRAGVDSASQLATVNTVVARATCTATSPAGTPVKYCQ